MRACAVAFASLKASWSVDTAGVERYGCEIIAETIDFLSRAKAATEEEPTFIEDEIPF